MSDDSVWTVVRYVSIGTLLFFTVIWLGCVIFTVRHAMNENDMAQKYKEENEMLKEEIKDMQERINALLNISVVGEDVDWNDKDSR